MTPVNKEWIEYFNYLETLNRSDVINMLESAPYLAMTFNIDETDARKILNHWIVHRDEIVELLKNS